LNFVTSEQWSVCDGINLEKIAYETIKANRNVLVIAGPGTGKTELLAQKACYLFQTNICRNPHKILAICFKNDAADNLKKRVLKKIKSLKTAQKIRKKINRLKKSRQKRLQVKE